GADNVSYCIPCPTGTFANASGSTYCSKCASDRYCPEGSSLQLHPKQRVQEFLTIDPMHEAEIYSQIITYSVKYGVSGFVIIAIVIILISVVIGMLFHSKKKGEVTPKFASLDVLFLQSHDIPVGTHVRSRKTSLGGWCLISTIVLSIVLFVLGILDFALNNTMHIETYRIKETSTSELVEGTFQASVVVYGAFPNCDGGVSVHGFSGTQNQTCRLEIEKGCICNWSCTNCK